MDIRLARFESFAQHPWLKRVYKRLSAEEMHIAREFICAHSDLPKGEFEYAVNRMFLDKPKPKRWTAILELLCCANSGI